MKARLIIAAGLLVATATVARAAPAGDHASITLPDGFVERPRLAERVADSAGFEDSNAGATAHVAEAGGAALYVTWADGRAPAENPAAVLETILTDIRAAPHDASPAEGSTVSVQWKLSEGENWLDAKHQWRHLSNETTTFTRALVYADTDGVVHVARADCVIAAGSPTFEDACEKALASLELSGDASTRQAIAAMPILAPGEKPPPAPSPELSAASGSAPGGPIYVNPDAGSGISAWWMVAAGGVGVIIGGIVFGIRRRRSTGDRG